MGVSSAYCENLPQTPGRSSPVLFLACSFTSNETNTILREFSVHLTFQAKDPARNHFSTLTPSPATFRLGHHLLFPLKSCCLERGQCIPGHSAELTVCLMQVGKHLDSGWKMTATNSHSPPKEPCASITFTNPINPASVFGNYKFHSPLNFQNFIGLIENPWRTIRQKFFTAVVQKMW